MNNDKLTSIEQATLGRRMARNADRIKKLEGFFQGQQLGTVRFADATIINAKIGSLSASKLTTGELNVATDFDIGDVSDDGIRFSGGDIRISMFNGGVEQLIIGMQGGVPVVKIAKNGVDADSDTNPDNFVLYVDQITNQVLIKEKERGSSSVASGFTPVNVAHGLGYVPLCFAFGEVSSGVWRKLYSHPLVGGLWFEVNATNLVLRNDTGSTKTVKWLIFYDLII